MYANEEKAGAEKALFRLASQNETSLTPPDGIEGVYLTQESGEKDAGGAGAAMRTLLSAFAEEFSRQMQPTLEPISRAIDTLEGAAETCRARSILPDLRDLHHQVSALIEKVEAQQAYVLIFGPLKSGKSTFMNALCGSYISEVTALPAYPCLVNVSHSHSEAFSITRYDGRSEDVEDRDVLRRRIESDHVSLIERIRQVEASGESFDPIGHMSEAIRKIDVKLPAGQLAASGAVLVDTPGLYTKMKFGYDRMTRDFRNSAACAIFIVKTDNLFLEQVFDEFGELLELFSRVFLVVNLDHSKQDLQPDGSLAPSLEREDPARIVQTFQDLSMSAALTEASREGRLRIYPVDLLRSASRRIRGLDEPEDSSPGETSFETLAEDLGSYLNSSEYLREFLRDSLRRGGSLLGELDDLVENEAVCDLGDQKRMLKAELEQARAKQEALVRIGKIDWSRQTAALANELTAELGQGAQSLHENTTLALAGAIEEWFDTDDCLDRLRQGRIQELLDHARDEMLRLAKGQLGRLSEPRLDWLEDASVREDLNKAGIDLEAILSQAVQAGRKQAHLERPEDQLIPGNIPVRKGFWDWVLLRSMSKVRKKVLGQGEARIDPAEKQKRLGDSARDAMRLLAVKQLDSLLDRGANDLPRRTFEAALEHLRKAVARAAGAMLRQTREQIEQTGGLLEQISHVVASTDALRDAIQAASAQVARLDEHYRGDTSDSDAPEASQSVEDCQSPEDEVIELEP